MKWLTKIFGETTSKRAGISVESKTKTSVRDSEKLIHEFRKLEDKLEHWATLKEEKEGLIFKCASMSENYLQAVEKYYGHDFIPYTKAAEYCEAAYWLQYAVEQDVGITCYGPRSAEWWREKAVDFYIQAADQNMMAQSNKKNDGAEYIVALRRLGEDGKADALVETMQSGHNYSAHEIRAQVIESKDLR
jgi:hypothetical protein